ncbi:MAG: 2-C-methyl-D-erythritol 4-phosphate cytidylyltransferase [Gammaproteobacteria bacterium]
MRRVWAAIPAAGLGARMGGDVPKQYLPLCGVPVLAHGLRRLGDHPKVSGVVVALAPGDPFWPRLEVRCRAPVRVTRGGVERCHSVLAALRELAVLGDGDDWALVHDAARPCLRRADLDRLIEALWDHPVGGLLAVPVGDTLKRAGPAGEVLGTVARDGLWQAQTPQMFRLGALIEALTQVAAGGGVVTDESQAMERMGLAPRLVEGHAGNIKITRPEDLARAALYLRSQDQESCASATATTLTAW